MSALCRLCMSPESLVDLLTIDGDSNLGIKVVSCIGIKELAGCKSLSTGPHINLWGRPMFSNGPHVTDNDDVESYSECAIQFQSMNLRIYPNDGLPTQICNTCKELLTTFFNFKQKCLEIDLKLRALASREILSNWKGHVDNHAFNKHLDIKKQCENKIVNTKIIENTKSKINYNNLTKDVFKISCTEDNKLTLKKKFQCEICGRIFKIKTGLENHILAHSGLKPYQCELCHKRYCRKESVTIHMRSHAGVKPYVCEICGKSTTKRHDLVRHMKVHSDERNYACSRCNRRFKRAGDVTSHMRTHTGIRPYHCQNCKKSYTSHTGLRKHNATHCKGEVVVAIRLHDSS